MCKRSGIRKAPIPVSTKAISYILLNIKPDIFLNHIEENIKKQRNPFLFQTQRQYCPSI